MAMGTESEQSVDMKLAELWKLNLSAEYNLLSTCDGSPIKIPHRGPANSPAMFSEPQLLSRTMHECNGGVVIGSVLYSKGGSFGHGSNWTSNSSS